MIDWMKSAELNGMGEDEFKLYVDTYPHTNKRVIHVCDSCGEKRNIVYNNNKDNLCYVCSGKLLAADRSDEHKRNLRNSLIAKCERPEYIEMMNNIFSSESFIHNCTVAAIERSKTPEWIANRKVMYETSSWVENNRIAQLKRWQNTRWNSVVDAFILGDPISDFTQSHDDYGINHSDLERWRVAVGTRDNWTCQTCNANGCVVHAHHIIPKRLDQIRILDVDNGIIMCPRCHAVTIGTEELFIDELQMMVDGCI